LHGVGRIVKMGTAGRKGRSSVRKLSCRKKLAFSASILVLSLLIAEFGLTFAVSNSVSQGDTTFYAWEDSGKTIRFDPVRGYWLGTTPSRFVRMAAGEVDCAGTIRGNAQGYPDAHDFTLRKPSGIRRRYLVLGDSFTAGWGLETNWPDRIEASRPELQLYNLSTDGGGLANWWSNLTRFAIAENYQFDGVIFAVFYGDTKRSFTIKDHRDTAEPHFARVGWKPETWPRMQAEADQFLKPLAGEYASHILSTEDFERALATRRLPVHKRQQPWIMSQLMGLPASIQRFTLPSDSADGKYDADQLALIDDIRRVRVPIIVVRIPTRESLITGWHEAEPEAFAKLLGGKFLDGADALRGLNPTQIRGLFFKHDGHWNQDGSNRFAAWVQKQIQ